MSLPPALHSNGINKTISPLDFAELSVFCVPEASASYGDKTVLLQLGGYSALVPHPSMSGVAEPIDHKGTNATRAVNLSHVAGVNEPYCISAGAVFFNEYAEIWYDQAERSAGAEITKGITQSRIEIVKREVLKDV